MRRLPKFIALFLFFPQIFPSLIRILNADPDPGGKMNADPCGSGSRSTALLSIQHSQNTHKSTLPPDSTVNGGSIVYTFVFVLFQLIFCLFRFVCIISLRMYHFVWHIKYSVSFKAKQAKPLLFSRYFALLIFASVSLRFASNNKMRGHPTPEALF